METAPAGEPYLAATEERPAVRIRRSQRRRRTLSARMEGRSVLVMCPAGMDPAQEHAAVLRLVDRLVGHRPSGTDQEDLMVRAERLARCHLDPRVGHPVRARSIRWVDNQHHRWGSCTVETAEIRLSRRLTALPAWVVDHVILHELCHLVVPGHGHDFKALLDTTPRAAEARGFLAGYQWAADASTDPSRDG